MKHPSNLRWLEGALWLVAAISSGLALTQLCAAKTARAGMADVSTGGTGSKTLTKDPLIGRLEIATIGLVVPIVDNYDAQQLTRGVGHVPGSALPGGLGNLVLAGHRDTFFRPLRNIRNGMKIEIVTPSGKYQYQVDSTEIVTPQRLEVLDIGERPELTLITCYPFDFVGSAPRRFIVHAHLLSVQAV